MRVFFRGIECVCLWKRQLLLRSSAVLKTLHSFPSLSAGEACVTSWLKLNPCYWLRLNVVHEACLTLVVLCSTRRPTNPAFPAPQPQCSSGSSPAAPAEVAQVCLSPPQPPHITPSVSHARILSPSTSIYFWVRPSVKYNFSLIVIHLSCSRLDDFLRGIGLHHSKCG